MDRLKIIGLAVITMFVFLVFGLLNLGLLHGGKYRQLSNKNCIRLFPQAGCRGKILDRNGSVIVDSRLSYDVLIMPQGLNQVDKILATVAKVLDVNFNDLKKTFKNNYISPSLPTAVARNIDFKKAIALEEIKQDTPGLLVQANPLRNYPYGNLAVHAIGYLNEIDRWRLTQLADYGYNKKDIVAFGGVEEKYDYYLRQEEGGLSVEVDHRGRFIRVLGFRPPQNGKDIELTLNLKIQQIAEKKLSDKKGCVIVMDPYTGEVIAMASSPSFDPSVFVNKKTSAIAELFNNKDAPLVNRATSGAYPAGSVFKVIVATAGLETKKINPATSFLCQGHAVIGRQQFACWSTHGVQNLSSAITHSCNVFFYKTGLLVGAQAIHDYALKFGLSKPTSLELPYEASGFIPSPLWRKVNKFKNWFDGDTANLSIGQGEVLVTPLQMARVMAVFANKGYLVNPYIVKSIDGREIVGAQKKNTPLSLKPSTLDYIRQGLRGVVAEQAGTGNVLSALSVPVAGKTGTAQAPPGLSHAWFTGFFPFEKPKFVICVFLEHGGPGYYSCVVAKEIIEEMIKEGLV